MSRADEDMRADYRREEALHMHRSIPGRRYSGALCLIAALAAVPVLFTFLARIRIGDTSRASVGARLERLRTQLAHVELEIKSILRQIRIRRLEEMDVKGQIEDEEAQTAKLFYDLEKAADAYTELLESIASMSAQ